MNFERVKRVRSSLLCLRSTIKSGYPVYGSDLLISQIRLDKDDTGEDDVIVPK